MTWGAVAEGRGSVRLAGGGGRRSRGRLGAASVRPGVPGGHRGHRVVVQRRNGGRADARRLCGDPSGRSAALALPVRVRLHR
ncbi:hypothetical protein G6F40_017683 [Rhizopus arrhizus]|nr:hypothetical protein G6F40_017683 [Rhizopus arrhizus]